MKHKLWPKTIRGKWAVSLSIAFLVLEFIKVFTGLPLPNPAIALLGLAGLVTGMLAIAKKTGPQWSSFPFLSER